MPPETHLASPRKHHHRQRGNERLVPNRAINPPEVSPQAAPTRTVTGIPIQADQPQWMWNKLKQTATNASTLPTDRSIPPVMMTSVMPQASSP